MMHPKGQKKNKRIKHVHVFVSALRIEIDFFTWTVLLNCLLCTVQCSYSSVVQLDHITLRQCQRTGLVNDVKHDSDEPDTNAQRTNMRVKFFFLLSVIFCLMT